MQILEAFDAMGVAHSAAPLCDADPKTVRRYVQARDLGRHPPAAGGRRWVWVVAGPRGGPGRSGWVAGAVTVWVALCSALAGRKTAAASEPSRAAAMAASTAVSEPVMKACWAAWARIWPPALCVWRAAVSAALREPVAWA